MKYWKQGFYDIPLDGSVELTDDHWRELLDGQSQGRLIVEDQSGYPVLRDRVQTLEQLRTSKLAQIDAYDKGSEVNSFSISGQSVWIDRDTRTGLSRMFGLERAAGKETTKLWYDTAQPPICFELPIDAAEQMLARLEMYAKGCYDVTQTHKAIVYTLDTAEAIDAYDHTTGYPERLNFTL